MLTASAAKRGALVDDLLREARLYAESDFVFDTVYFGGGTPSILAVDDLARLLDGLRSILRVVPEARLTFEANPEDVSPASVRDWRALGVQTLSLGVQSFVAEELRFLGRRHTPDEARDAVDVALTAEFGVVSLDLIFGLPDQSESACAESLRAACALAAQHVSCYQLTVTGGTPFGRRRERGQLVELDDGAQARHFERVHDELSRGGYEAYEVSNFARRPRWRSRHNQKYWRHAPYLGLGPSAHSFRPGGVGRRVAASIG